MQLQLWRDSSAARALMHITRGPGFDPQSHCLNFFPFSVLMSVLSFDGVKENGLFDVLVTVRINLSNTECHIVILSSTSAAQ